MARHRVIPFDDASRPELRNVIPDTDPKYPAIRRRLIETWLMTFAGYTAMLGLVILALWGFGYPVSLLGLWGVVGFGGLFWLVLPLVMWWFCDKIAIMMTKSVPADPSNPRHKRVLDCVDRVFARSGMKYKPPVYASPNPLPNAFATGPIHRKAVVAFTEGLLECGMNDAEIEAVFAHELGHVRNYDVGINSFLAILSSLFTMVAQAGVRAWMNSIEFLRKLLGLKPTTRIFPAILSNIVFYVIFWVCGQFTRIIQMFVVRSRESGADATGAYMTGDPCSLSMALQKLVAYATKNRPKLGSEDFAMYQALRPIMIVDPLFDKVEPDPAPRSWWDRIKQLWKYVQLTHPPVSERIYHLERMNGGRCPRI